MIPLLSKPSSWWISCWVPCFIKLSGKPIFNILIATPWLRIYSFTPEPAPPAIALSSTEGLKRGVEVKRLIFGKRLSKPKYLARYRVIDLFLDTLPYNAATTASDALRMGLPVLTCKGKSFASRVAASVINAVNLPELITNNQKEYEALAIELATNPEKFKSIKEKLKDNLSTSPLYDTQKFTENLESIYKVMYERHHDGLEPEHIYIKH